MEIVASSPAPTAREVADRQLIAYNAHDLDAFCALFAADAELSDLLTGQVVASGLDEIRQRYGERFAIGDLRCEVHTRMDLGEVAIDRETVFGLPDGPVDMIAVYEVRAGLIRTIRFVRQSAG
jgi:hypothetical protein